MLPHVDELITQVREALAQLANENASLKQALRELTGSRVSSSEKVQKAPDPWKDDKKLDQPSALPVGPNRPHTNKTSLTFGDNEEMESLGSYSISETSVSPAVQRIKSQYVAPDVLREGRRPTRKSVKSVEASEIDRHSQGARYWLPLRRLAREFCRWVRRGCIINPEVSPALEVWDFVTAICLVWVAFIAPFQLCFLDLRMDALFVVNSCLDVVFFIDMLLQFIILYSVQSDYGHFLVGDRKKIALHYLRTWFVVDCVSIIPFDIIGLEVQNQSVRQIQTVKTIRLFRLLKLARMVRASRLFRRFEGRMSMSYASLSLLKFFTILLVITHWLACLWALTLKWVEDTDGVPRWVDVFTSKEVNVPAKTKDTPGKLYVAALYFTTYTITSVGYGDIGPQKFIEIVVCTIMLIVAGISWAIVLGQVSGVVASMDPHEKFFQTTMDELRRLGRDVVGMHKIWIKKVPFLSKVLVDVSSRSFGAFFYAFIVDVALSMKVEMHAQMEVFGTTHHMYVLTRGMVSQNTGEPSVRTSLGFGGNGALLAGAVWGLDFLVFDIALQSPVQACAMTFVETLTIERQTFSDLVDRHDRLCPDLKREIRRYTCRLALQRGVMREARRRSLLLKKRERKQSAKRRSDVADNSIESG